MKKSLIAVGVVGLMGLTSVAMAAEFNWSGTIRAGYTSVNKGGATDRAVKTIGENKSSRINLNASTDLGNGQSAGAELSYSVGGALTTRRQNIWLNGSWGKLTLGKHGGIYRSAANWDQSSYLGGNVRFDTGASGDTGLIYASNIPGPFSFKFEVASAAGTSAVEATVGHYRVTDTGTANVRDFYSAKAPKKNETVTTTLVNGGVARVEVVDTITVVVKGVEAKAAVDGKSVGRWATIAQYDFGIAKVNLGYNTNTIDADGSVSEKGLTRGSYNNTAISVNGSASGLSYNVAYEINKANPSSVDQKAAPFDAKTIGVFLSYDASANDRIYIEHENAKIKNIATDNKEKATLLGYRRDLGEGIDFTIEYSTISKAASTLEPKNLNMVLRYDF